MVFVSISLLTPMAFCSISNCRITPTSRIDRKSTRLNSSHLPYTMLFRSHLRADPRHLLNGLRVHFAAHPNGLLQHFELPHHADQPHCGLGHRHVRTFELSLLHFHIGCRRRQPMWECN